MERKLLVFSLLVLGLIGGGLAQDYQFENSPTAEGEVLKDSSTYEWGVGQFKNMENSVVEREVQKGEEDSFLLGVRNFGVEEVDFSLKVVGDNDVVSNVELGQKDFSLRPDGSNSYPVSVSYRVPSDFNGTEFDFGVRVSDDSWSGEGSEDGRLLMRFDGGIEENSVRSVNSLSDRVQFSGATIPFWVIPLLGSTLVFLLLVATAGFKAEVVASSLFFSIVVAVFLSVLFLTI